MKLLLGIPAVGMAALIGIGVVDWVITRRRCRAVTVTIIRGNALDLPLADNSVDLVVTSPPYFGLRSYQDGGEHYDGQLGAEATPAEFVDALIAATREMVRVVKPCGSIFVNLGDKYSTGNGGESGLTELGKRLGTGGGQKSDAAKQRNGRVPGMKPKSLIGIPWRYALRCIDDLGLILRAEVIWSKPNGLPESVTDRVRRSHEQWFHFVQMPRYFSAVDEVREEFVAPRPHDPMRGLGYEPHMSGRMNGATQNPLGKLPGSVWTIPEGESLARSVLRAVADGGITIDEGERILTWSTRSGSGPTPHRATDAGSGRDSAIGTDMAGITPSRSSRSEHLVSPTNSPPDPSLMGSPSTTSAGTHAASDPITSSPCPSASTVPDDHGRMSAPQDTSTTNGTPTSDATASGSAERAWLTDPGTIEHADGPPSVWQIATQPLTVPAHLGVDHFAAFPMEWPRRFIRGWSPAGMCVECGEGRRPVSNVERVPWAGDPLAMRAMTAGAVDGGPRKWKSASRQIVSETCDCPEPTADTTPGTVLDPFGGTGTTALVAHALGRHGISVDMSADYCRLAEWRTTDPGQIAAAMQVEKPAAVMDGQLDIFGEATA